MLTPLRTKHKNLIATLYHYMIIFFTMMLLFLPLVALVVYSLSTTWGATFLPDGLTFKWFVQLFSDERFYWAFLRSLYVCFMSLLLSTLVLLPVTFLIFYKYPKLEKWMNLIILLPFAMPPVVASVGLLQLYSSSSLIGGPNILILSYFSLVLPFMYKAFSGSIQSIPIHELLDAAKLMGTHPVKAFFKVILPNIKQGIFTAWFIGFSFMFGEFVFANMLVGTRFETLQVYLFNMRSTSGHFTSALVVSYFIFVLIMTFIAMRLSASKSMRS